MGFEFAGGFALTEDDLPEIEYSEQYGARYAVASNGAWNFDIDQETDEVVLDTIKSHLAYWLWRQRNPELVKPVDPEVVDSIVTALDDLGEFTTHQLDMIGETLTRAGFRRE